jgi:8-oxo-dGTP diphosphatase
MPMASKSLDPDEEAFLEGYDPSAFERPSVAVDVVLLSVLGERLATLLVRRSAHPFRGRWALPGSFVDVRESLDDAAARLLARKVGLDGVFLEQLYTFGAPDRDPRTRVISVAYYALVDGGQLGEPAPDRTLATLEVPWEGETGGPVDVVDDGGRTLTLAFDHDEILGMAVKRIRGKLDYTPIGFQLLPRRFTLRQLQAVHETVLGRPLNKDSFRRRMLASGWLEATGEHQRDVDHRPAELYRISRRSAV